MLSALYFGYFEHT